MYTYPLLEIDLDRIQRNAAAVVKICSDHGISVAGVVKGVCGSPRVAKAMLAGGVTQIGDSRISNLQRLRNHVVNRDLLMLRIPMLSQVPALLRACDISLNSELMVIQAMSAEAVRIGRIHKVILMIELGDLREGVLPGDAPYMAERIAEMPGIKLEGIGTNLTCYSGVAPSPENMGILADVASAIEERTGVELPVISGGNSSSIPLIIAGKMPARINHIRIGEGILLGQDTLTCGPIPGTVRNAFSFKAEVIEAGKKPTAPIGEIVSDAFGGKPEFKDRGIRKHAILGAGRQDITVSGLLPTCNGCTILGASSDHLLVDVEDSTECIRTGDILAFNLKYCALLSAMTSEYVEKSYTDEPHPAEKRKIAIIAAPFSIGANIPGSELAPEAMLGQGLGEMIMDRGCELIRVPDAIPPALFDEGSDFATKKETVIAANQKLACIVREQISSGAFPLVLGGDHTVTIGTLNGILQAERKNTGLIVFGAFANLHTSSSSLTKNLHGLTLSACTGLENLCNPTSLPQENMIIIGLRRLDNPEKDLLKDAGINLFTMEDIDLKGIPEVICQSLELLKHCSNGIHISFSMDAISPEYAPGVSIPVEGGISFREAHLAMELLSRSQRVVSMDLVELNPINDTGNRSSRLAVHLIGSLLGQRIVS
jgi:arginase